MNGSAFKQSYRGLFWNLVGVAVSFANGVATARLLLPEGRGTLSITLALSAILALFAGLGSNVAFRALAPKRLAGVVEYLKLSAILSLLASGFGVLIAFWVLRPSLDQNFRVADLLLVCLIVWLSYASTQGYDILNAAGKNSVSARVNAIGNAFVLGGLLALSSLGLDTVAVGHVFIAYAAAYLLRLCLISLEVWRHSDQLPRSIEGSSQVLMRSGLKFMGLNVGMAFAFRVDLIAVDLFLGAAAAGVYSVAAVPAAVLQIISSTLGQVVFRHVADGSFGRKQVLIYASSASGLTLVGAIGIFAVADWVVPIAFGVAYEPAIPILKWLAVAQLCLAPYFVFSRAAAGLMLTRVASLSGIIGVALMVISLVVLVPALGVAGAVISCGVTYAAMSAFVCFPVLRRLSRE